MLNGTLTTIAGHPVYLWTPALDRRAAKKQARQRISPGTSKRQRERSCRYYTRCIRGGIDWPPTDAEMEDVAPFDKAGPFAAVHWADASYSQTRSRPTT